MVRIPAAVIFLLVAAAVFVSADYARDDQTTHLHRVCEVYEDGSARCPSGTFEPDGR